MKFNKLIFVFLSVFIIIACVLSVIVNENASISINSVPAIVFGICSVIYAVIAFANQQRRNLFVLGKNKFLIAFLSSFKDDNLNNDSDTYQKEFAFSAFIFCASIPFYIPLAFLVKSFSVAFTLTLSVTVLRMLFTLILVLIPRIIKNAQDQKRERIRDEADRKEQEYRESMGKWK